jgi:hypothetical protein
MPLHTLLTTREESRGDSITYKKGFVIANNKKLKTS